MTTYNIFKIKKGKRPLWEEWCKEILKRKEESITTLVEENLIAEKCVIFGTGDCSYVFYKHTTVDGKGKKPMNLDREINQKHQDMMRECLEEVENKVVGYDLEVVSQNVIEKVAR